MGKDLAYVESSRRKTGTEVVITEKSTQDRQKEEFKDSCRALRLVERNIRDALSSVEK